MFVLALRFTIVFNHQKNRTFWMPKIIFVLFLRTEDKRSTNDLQNVLKGSNVVFFKRCHEAIRSPVWCQGKNKIKLL